MGESATNGNIYQYYRGIIYYTFSRHEGFLTFCESYEGDWICNRNSILHSEGDVQSFWKTSNSSQRQSRGNRTHGLSTKSNLYQAHHGKILSLPDLLYKWWCRNKNVDTKELIVYFFTNPLDTELFRYIRYNLNGLRVNGILLWEVFLDYTHEASILEDSSEKD